MIPAFCPPLMRGRVAGRNWPSRENIMIMNTPVAQSLAEHARVAKVLYSQLTDDIDGSSDLDDH
jgi:hypothetical protein